MAYDALETNYKDKYNPNRFPETGEYMLVNLDVSSPGLTFRVYVPGGATKVGFKLYVPQDAQIGVAVRMGQYPQCNYVIVPEDYYDLPWGPYNGTSIAALNGLDFQARNMGGQIVILSSAIVSGGENEWIYVKVLRYDSNVIGILYLAVWVDAVEYKDWYDNHDWDGENPSQPFSGNLGGYCDSAWGEQDPPPEGYIPVLMIF